MLDCSLLAGQVAGIIGLYDTLHDYEASCPYCGRTAWIDIQTKDLDRFLEDFTIHYPSPKFRGWAIFEKLEKHAKTDRLRYVRALASCTSPMCTAIGSMRAFIDHGSTGYGRFWDLRYAVRAGVVTGPGVVTERGPTEHFAQLRRLVRARLRKSPAAARSFEKVRAATGGDFGLALMLWDWHPRMRHRPTPASDLRIASGARRRPHSLSRLWRSRISAGRSGNRRTSSGEPKGARSARADDSGSESIGAQGDGV